MYVYKVVWCIIAVCGKSGLIDKMQVMEMLDKVYLNIHALVLYVNPFTKQTLSDAPAADAFLLKHY